MSQDQPPLFDIEALTYDELSLRLKISKTQLKRLVASGKIPHRKVGRVVRFYWPLIVDWLSRRKGA